MSLRVYKRKRKFDQTPEPKGKAHKKGHGPLRFVVQMHHATRLHYDFRLEFDGVFKSWAVPRGPSLNPQDQRLAVFVEDHPLEYGSFEGIIPKGNYGAGTVMLWDEGTFVERSSENREQSEEAMRKGFAKGHLTFVLEGQKLKGEFALIKLKKDADEKAWLLVKKRDAYSTYKRNQALDNTSVKTGRSIEQIAKESVAAGNIWLPKHDDRSTKAKKKAKPLKAPSPKSRDPMPRKNKPMLATVTRDPVHGEQWIFEESRQGLRALAEVEGKRVHIYSRSGLPFAKKFPEIVEALKKLDHHAVLDGEIVKDRGGAFYSVFDILYSGDRDLRKEPLRERRKILHEVIPRGKQLRLAETAKRKAGVQLTAKNLDSIYRAGTSSDWLIVQEAKAPASTASTKELRLTNLDKIFWPKEGITKGDLLEYYREVAPYILPYLKDRPESLNRHPSGIAAAGFYQKDMTGHIPRWLKTERIFSESADKSIDYVVCQDERSLLYIVNLGCIEINPWLSRINKPDHPDFLVIDLDPDGNDFDHVIEIAHEFHEILDHVGAQNFCKTSGATGIHIGIPLGARYDFDHARSFAEKVCRIVAQNNPASTSVERTPARRKGKIYLDFLQNRRGQTLAAPFCVRPKSGAPVSMPLTWTELKSGLKPEQFHLKNAPRLIAKRKDPWKGVLGAAIDLEKCVTKVSKRFKV